MQHEELTTAFQVKEKDFLQITNFVFLNAHVRILSIRKFSPVKLFGQEKIRLSNSEQLVYARMRTCVITILK